MKHLTLFLPFLLLLTLLSCNDDDNATSNPATLQCDKLTSREEANNLIDQLNDDPLADSATIVANLIGEWGLIGMVPGWIGFEAGQECFKLTISPELIVLEDLNSGNNSSSEWVLRTIKVNSYTGFYLETNEAVWNNRMGMEVFTENIMLGSGRVDDGNIYIYEKL